MSSVVRRNLQNLWVEEEEEEEEEACGFPSFFACGKLAAKLAGNT